MKNNFLAYFLGFILCTGISLALLNSESKSDMPIEIIMIPMFIGLGLLVYGIYEVNNKEVGILKDDKQPLNRLNTVNDFQNKLQEIQSKYYALIQLEITNYNSNRISETEKSVHKLYLKEARLTKTNPILHFPLFVEFIHQMNNEMSYDYYLIKEDGNEVAFAAKIIFFGNVVGWNILSITIDELLEDDYDYKLKTVSAKGYSMESYIDNFSKDENPDANLFQKGFKSVALRLIANPTYLEISQGKI